MGKKKNNKNEMLLDGYQNEEEISIVPMEVWEDSLLLALLSSWMCIVPKEISIV